MPYRDYVSRSLAIGIIQAFKSDSNILGSTFSLAPGWCNVSLWSESFYALLECLHQVNYLSMPRRFRWCNGDFLAFALSV
jgi:hypothetical protein